MKLHLISRDNLENNSFMITKHSDPSFLKVWHYHPELELVLTLKSTGTRFVGDSIKKFDEGDLVLIGKNLPHMWVNDDRYFEPNSKLIAEDIVIHFKEDFLGKDFFETKEMKPILQLLTKAKYGLKFISIPLEIPKKITQISNRNGFDRTIELLTILNKLAQHKNYEILSSEGYIKTFNKTKNVTLDNTYEYIFENFNKPISLEDVANVANMNSSAFSRYFKRVNRKTFSRYLNEVRIGYACNQLIEQKGNIASICYDSGFNNISNFNRQFKKITLKSPSEYLRHHTQVS
ncbi:AraC family transcriptional regulator [uncultured Maribacter sp.]|uniref:AraC family transcriptional regulator n=1 Tax=uncultured Maribacter sp. TaxID=431308 RepID=UPI00263610A2|nr:AraC family transcriptional regulator [uncultured Maribacter sp.]